MNIIIYNELIKNMRNMRNIVYCLICRYNYKKCINIMKKYYCDIGIIIISWKLVFRVSNDRFCNN